MTEHPDTAPVECAAACEECARLSRMLYELLLGVYTANAYHGVVVRIPDDAARWWHEHRDRRCSQEAAERRIVATRRGALAKLSHEEKQSLGLA